MEDKILKITLENAVTFGGKAQTNNVIGKVIAAFPELKKDMKNTYNKINEIVKKVNSMSLDEQNRKLNSLGGIEKKEKEVKEREIPNIEVKGKLVVRFAPNPNGPISLGHCRPALWNWFLAQKYNGEYILRFDDTDPKTKIPMKEAYDWFEDDLNWLGIKPSKVVRQSSRLKVYYVEMRKLLKLDKAYVCTCDSKEWKKLIEKKKGCKCRDIKPEEQIKRWECMFDKYQEGGAVARIKTDLKHPNPAVRDWPAFRIIDNASKHPFEKNAKVWPLLNFASAIDDHEFGITYIVRGVDLQISDIRQKYIYDYFGWAYPKTIYHGKLLVEGIKSTSASKEMIEKGELIGWDDPRLGTIKAFRRKGFSSEAIVKFIKEVGIGSSDVNVALDKLAAFNKEVIDSKAFRFFFVQDPVKVRIEGAPKIKVELDLHPKNNKSGRKFVTDENFYISRDDYNNFKDNHHYRLMGCLNFIKKGNKLIFHSENQEEFKGQQLIHWLPFDYNHVIAELMTEEAVKVRGLCEEGVLKLKEGDILQFVRVGFVKLDKKGREMLEFWFSHR